MASTTATAGKILIPSTSTMKSTSKATKSLILKLKVPKEILAKFQQPSPPIKTSTVSSPAPIPEASTPSATVAQEPKKEVNGDSKPPPIKAGVKRNHATANTTTMPKPRARPGPKRRKVETDDSLPWTVTMTGPGAHKLGPKANQGAINANLRALDRKNLNPCRKWGKKTLRLKTFNGSEWSLNRWSAPPKAERKTNGVENSTPSSNSDNVLPSSNVPSVTSHQPEESKGSAAVAAPSPAVVAA